MARLRYIDPTTMQEKVIPLRVDQPTLSMGSDSKSGLRLEHESVAARHAVLQRRDDGNWEVVDVGSPRGVRVGGRSVDSATLTDGVRFLIGDVDILFEQAAPPPPPSTSTLEEETSSLDARKLATAAFDKVSGGRGYEIDETQLFELGFGWVFIATRSDGQALPPVAVERGSGKTSFLSLLVPIEVAITEFEKKLIGTSGAAAPPPPPPKTAPRRRVRVRLISYERDEYVLEIDDETADINIGRRDDNHIVLAAPQVSRLHALVQVRGDQLTIYNSSRGGVMVNRQLVQQSSKLLPDDRVNIGPYELRFEVA